MGTVSNGTGAIYMNPFTGNHAGGDGGRRCYSCGARSEYFSYDAGFPGSDGRRSYQLCARCFRDMPLRALSEYFLSNWGREVRDHAVRFLSRFEGWSILSSKLPRSALQGEKWKKPQRFRANRLNRSRQWKGAQK
jgi:hypothetical protein